MTCHKYPPMGASNEVEGPIGGDGSGSVHGIHKSVPLRSMVQVDPEQHPQGMGPPQTVDDIVGQHVAEDSDEAEVEDDHDVQN